MYSEQLFPQVLFQFPPASVAEAEYMAQRATMQAALRACGSPHMIDRRPEGQEVDFA